ncbi:hypothetical protein STEG23_036352 [Scotinomys teguina]
MLTFKQEPILPTNKQLMSAQKRQQYMDQAYTYTRIFCGSLSGFSLLLLICMAPLSWVQFLVTNNGLELNAGLWTLCSHELCWSHTPKPPYYLQYSRALFILSVLCMLTGLGLLFSSCRPTEGTVSSELDLKVSVLSFCSAFCLLLCLNLFLAQVDWYTKSAMESQFLWAYYFNWCSDVLCVCVVNKSSAADPFLTVSCMLICYEVNGFAISHASCLDRRPGLKERASDDHGLTSLKLLAQSHTLLATAPQVLG